MTPTDQGAGPLILLLLLTLMLALIAGTIVLVVWLATGEAAVRCVPYTPPPWAGAGLGPGGERPCSFSDGHRGYLEVIINPPAEPSGISLQ